MRLFRQLPLRLIVFLAIVAVAVMMGRSYYERARGEGVRDLMRLGLEGVAKRVYDTEHNLRTVTAMDNAAALAKARSLAQLVKAEPQVLRNSARLRELCRTLDVDELYVSDSNGVLIAALPDAYRGKNMNDTEQSRPFMAAITNRNFELIQDPQAKGIQLEGKEDRRLFRYVGVARLDSPGIVQIGQRIERIEEARKLADVTEIARSSRIGRHGKVEILPAEGLPKAQPFFVRQTDVNGDCRVMLERDCSVWRIRIYDDDKMSWLSRGPAFVVLGVAEILLVVGLFLLGSSLRRLKEGATNLMELLRGGACERRGFWRRAMTNPVIQVSAVILLVSIATTWLLVMRHARRNAEEVLLSSIADMRANIEDCVDEQLFYQGDAICKRFKTPEAVTEEGLQSVMRQYDIDELNVVDSRGIVIMGAVAERGYDMSSNPTSAKFNCLLRGQKTYSQKFRGAIENPDLRRKYAGIAFPPPAKGYVQLGFDEHRVRNDIDYWFADVALGWHIFEEGFFIVAKEDTGEIDSCGMMVSDGQGGSRPACRPGDTLASVGFNVDSAPTDAQTFFTAELFGVPCLCLTEVRLYHRIIAAVPLDEIYVGSRFIMMSVMVILLLVFLIVVWFMTRLSDVVASLKAERAANVEQQKRELMVARTIQMSSLPVQMPADGSSRICAEMQTAREVGGDFYDFYSLPSGRKFFLVADVSDKGISAAMFMMKAKAIIKACVFGHADLAKAVAEANSRLAEGNEANMFVTSWMGAVDPATEQLEYVNAGHNPPLIKRADGSVEWIRSRPGLALSALSGVTYRTEHLQLKPGDRLFLYTDGVTEAMNEKGELYGEARLERILTTASASLLETVRNDIQSFVGAAERSDDITMLVFDYLMTTAKEGRHGEKP